MKKYVYTIFDKAAQIYHNPWLEISDDAAAARAFEIASSDSGPADFVLYRIGSFDDASGLLSQSVIPDKVC